MAVFERLAEGETAPRLNDGTMDGQGLDLMGVQALSFRARGEHGGEAVESIQMDSGLFPAATVDNLSTGFGLFDGSPWEYGTAPHIALTAWFVMAINGFNPYSFNH